MSGNPHVAGHPRARGVLDEADTTVEVQLARICVHRRRDAGGRDEEYSDQRVFRRLWTALPRFEARDRPEPWIGDSWAVQADDVAAAIHYGIEARDTVRGNQRESDQQQRTLGSHCSHGS